MTKYLKKDVKVNVTDPQYIESFNTLKPLLMNLTYPDFIKNFVLIADASQYALGAVHSQDNNPI